MAERVAILRTERKRLADLGEHAEFLREHPADDAPEIVALDSSLSHDYFAPLIWNERNGLLVDGVKRKRRLMALGFVWADVGVVSYDDATHLARMRAANDHTGSWNKDLERALAQSVKDAGIPPELGMWDAQSLAMLLDPPAVPDDDPDAIISQADELQQKWQVHLGDLFEIGSHRLFCGDCTTRGGWDLLLQGRLADMVWTDPPYNIDYGDVQRRRNEAKQPDRQHAKAQGLMNDAMSAAAYKKLLIGAFREAFAACKPGAAIYIAHADMWRVVNEFAARRAGWKIRQNIQWVKSSFTLGMQDYQWQHEPILYGWKPGAGHYWQGGYRQSTTIEESGKKFSAMKKNKLVEIIHDLLNGRDTTVIREPRPVSNGPHPTIKPLHLVARMIWNSSREGDTVIECFGGSGTTMAAAERINRRVVAKELDPKYCAVILERMSAHGLSPKLLGNHVALT